MSKVPKWEFDPKAEAGPGAQRFIEMLYGGFELAAEQAVHARTSPRALSPLLSLLAPRG